MLLPRNSKSQLNQLSEFCYTEFVICLSNCVVEVLTSVIFECLGFLIHLTGRREWLFFFVVVILGRITSSLDGVRINI